MFNLTTIAATSRTHPSLIKHIPYRLGLVLGKPVRLVTSPTTLLMCHRRPRSQSSSPLARWTATTDLIVSARTSVSSDYIPSSISSVNRSIAYHHPRFVLHRHPPPSPPPSLRPHRPNPPPSLQSIACAQAEVLLDSTSLQTTHLPLQTTHPPSTCPLEEGDQHGLEEQVVRLGVVRLGVAEGQPGVVAEGRLGVEA